MADIQKLNVNSTTYDISVPWGKVTGKPSTFKPDVTYNRYISAGDGNTHYAKLLTIECTATSWGDLQLEFDVAGRGHKRATIRIAMATHSSGKLIATTAISHEGNILSFFKAYKISDSTTGADRIELWMLIDSWSTYMIYDKLYEDESCLKLTWNLEKYTAWPTYGTEISISSYSLPASDVYSWAKASSKPSYTAAEVGLGNVANYGLYDSTNYNTSVGYAVINGGVMEVGNRIDFHSVTGSNDYEVSLRINSGENTKRKIYFPASEGTLALTSQIPSYSTATSSTLGLVKIGYTANGKNYPVQLSNGQMYVNVPWTDTNTDTNTWRPITDSYSGTASDTSLSQKGGKAIYDALVNGYASSAGSAGYASGIIKIDDRSDNTNPYGDVTGQVTWHLKTNSSVGLPSTQTYSGVMILSPWGDSSGGAEHWLAFNSDGNIYHRSGISSWGSWKTLCYTDHTHNYAASSHTHDDRYYTETEVNNLLNGKANSSHDHNYINATACSSSSNSKKWNDVSVDALKLKVWDVYNDGGPTTYGNILEINGISGHWKPQIWFDSGTGQMRVRNRNYNATTWGDWRTVLDSVNSSVSKSGETLTVKINGVSQSLTNTNTWRPVTNTYTGTDTSTCVSQKGTNDLYNALVNGYASSAGSVPWTGVTGKPTIFTANGQTGSDCNSIKTNGSYYVSATSANSPGAYGEMLCMSNVDTHAQIYVPYSNGAMKFRGANNANGYYSWRTVIDDNNISSYALTSLPSHTHSYLPLSGGTLTGLLTTTSGSSHNGIKIGSNYINAINGDLIFQNNGTIRFGGDSWDYNVWAGLKYVHSSKSIYLGLADGTQFTANNAQSGGKMYFPGISGLYASAYYQSSDERVKTFYDPIKVDLEKLKKLRKNYFKFNDKDKLEIGVSAQEIQSLYPEIVTENDEGYLSVAYDKLSVIALKAVDELNDINNKQQKEIDDLKDQLSTIKNILKEKGIL